MRVSKKEKERQRENLKEIGSLGEAVGVCKGPINDQMHRPTLSEFTV